MTGLSVWEVTCTIDSFPTPIIQLLLTPPRSLELRPLPLPPFAPVVSNVVVSKPQLGQLCFTEGDGETERC